LPDQQARLGMTEAKRPIARHQDRTGYKPEIPNLLSVHTCSVLQCLLFEMTNTIIIILTGFSMCFARVMPAVWQWNFDSHAPQRDTWQLLCIF